jgi:hypothetical protein
MIIEEKHNLGGGWIFILTLKFFYVSLENIHITKFFARGFWFICFGIGNENAGVTVL